MRNLLLSVCVLMGTLFTLLNAEEGNSNLFIPYTTHMEYGRDAMEDVANSRGIYIKYQRLEMLYDSMKVEFKNKVIPDYNQFDYMVKYSQPIRSYLVTFGTHRIFDVYKHNTDVDNLYMFFVSRNTPKYNYSIELYSFNGENKHKSNQIIPTINCLKTIGNSRVKIQGSIDYIILNDEKYSMNGNRKFVDYNFMLTLYSGNYIISPYISIGHTMYKVYRQGSIVETAKEKTTNHNGVEITKIFRGKPIFIKVVYDNRKLQEQISTAPKFWTQTYILAIGFVF